MLSLLLVTAMSAVADTTPAPARVPTQAYVPAQNYSYYQPMNYSYSVPRGFDAAGACYCPTCDVDLFLPCSPAAPCSPVAPCPVGAPRVRTYPCPPPIRYCPYPGRPGCP